MKRFMILALTVLLIQVTAQAQNKYSLESLEKASQEELEVYLDKSLKLQKTGKTVTIIGGSILGATAATIAGVAIIHSDEDWALGGLMIGVLGGTLGLGTMTTGIIMKASGKKRVKRINSIENSAFNDIRVDVKPGVQYNPVIQNYQSGITLSITF